MGREVAGHRLNMEVYLGSMSRDVHSWTHWLRTPFLPPHLDSYYEGANGQQR